MKCNVSLNINEGSHKSNVSNFGAKAITQLTEARVNKNTLDSKALLPTVTKLNNNPDKFNKAASYIFSNSGKVTAERSNTLIGTKDPEVRKALNAAGANLYKGISEDYFDRNPNNILSPTPNNETKFVAENILGEAFENTDTRTFLNISSEDIDRAREIARTEFGSVDDDYTEEAQKLFEEGMEFLIISGLYRGFDVVIGGALPDHVLNNALKKYKLLNNTPQKVNIISSDRIGENIIKVNNAEMFINNEEQKGGKVFEGPVQNDEHLVLNAFTSTEDRKTLNKYKRAENTSKIAIANRVIRVFKKMMPNFEAEVLTSHEIEVHYGRQFATKKGFIIGNKVILNADKFTSSTVFHEFGHYYLAWVKINNPEMFEALMREISSSYETLIPSYTQMYEATGIKFSDNDILEEIFVDRLGLLAGSFLDSAIVNNLSDEVFTDTVDQFAQQFLIKMTGNKDVILENTSFTIHSTVADLFNITLENIGFLSSSLIGNMNSSDINSMKDFLIDKMSIRQVFNGLLLRGFIHTIGDDKVILRDNYGNRYNADGEIDQTAVIKMMPWNSYENVMYNKRVINNMSAYLNKFKHFADVKFTVRQDPNSVVQKILERSDKIHLANNDTAYKDGDGNIQVRSTQYLQDTFTDAKKTEDFVEYSTFHELTRDILNTKIKARTIYLETIGSEIDNSTLEIERLNKEASEDASKEVNDKTSKYEEVRAYYESLFEFKTTEGTYLHDVAELYFRALNYSLSIKYKNAPETRGLLYFRKHIIAAITKSDTVDFKAAFDEYFFNPLAEQNLNAGPEYDKFKKSFDNILSVKDNKKDTAANTALFLQELDSTVTKEFANLKGPLKILPEVTVSSKSFGYAGKIDLLVIDGDGEAYIYDYKTKENTKNHLTKWRGGSLSQYMKGAMRSYKETPMIKASIQTSMYKIALREMGINVKNSKVLYVLSDISKKGRIDELYTADDMSYVPKSVTVMGLQDVTGDLLAHFKSEGKTSDLLDVDILSKPIIETINKAAGGKDIETMHELEATAKNIFERAVGKREKELSGLDDLVNYFVNQKQRQDEGLLVTIGSYTARLDVNITDEEAIAQIVDMLKERKEIASFTSSLNNVFNSLNTIDGYSKDSGLTSDLDVPLRSTLSGVNAATHEFVKISSDMSYGNDFNNVAMVTNKVTKETRMIVLNHDYEDSLFDESRDNILGNYLSNNIFKARFPTIKWRGTNHNMRLIKAGMMMAMQKYRDPEFKVNILISNRPPGYKKDKTIPVTHDVGNVLMVTKALIDEMIKAGEVLPPEILELSKRPDLFRASSYKADPVNALKEYLSMASHDFTALQPGYSKSNTKNRDKLKNILEKYNSAHHTQRLLNALIDFQFTLGRSVYISESDRENSDLWNLLSHVILDLNEFNFMVSPKETNFVQNFAMPTSQMSNTFGASFNRKIQESTTSIRSGLLEYTNAHDKVLKALAKSKGVDLDSLLSAASYKSSMKFIFERLWINDNSVRETAFILEDYNNPTKTLSKEEKDYLKFFNKTLNEFANASNLSYKDVELPPSWVPLIGKSRLGYRQDTTIVERLREAVKSVSLDSRLGNEETGASPALEFTVESKFVDQYPDKVGGIGDQFSHSRRNLLGLSNIMQEQPNAKDNKPLKRIEDNLENILSAFVMSSLDSQHYRTVSAFGRALYYRIKESEKITNTVFPELIKTISLIQKRVIKHEESDSSNNSAAKPVGKFATTAVIAGTVSQALLETITNPMVTTSLYMADKLYGVMFNGSRDFSAASYTKAFKLVNFGSADDKALIRAINNLYGITTADTRALKEMLKKVEGKSIFQSDKLMFVNKLMMETWQKITMVAFMIEQGSYEAHKLNSEGNLVYDYKKDKRFAKSKGLEGKRLYEAVKAKLGNQIGGLTGKDTDEYEDRDIARAWSIYDSNYVKEMVVEMYSSMDDTSKSLAMYYQWMQFFGKFRTWTIPKIARYFKKPMTAEENASSARPKKIMDPDMTDENPEDRYRIEYVSDGDEGIIYTVWNLMRQTAEYKFNVFAKAELKEYQKKNMANLISDVGIMTFFSLAAYGVFAGLFGDDAEKERKSSLVYQRWQMATGDVFFLKALADLSTGNSSLFLGLSVVSRALKASAEAALIYPEAIFNDDVGAAQIFEANDKLFGSVFGPYRSYQVLRDYAYSIKDNDK